ncbi:hypothetical protein BDP81DRAFT_445206 [Colletotrichum phormii]|uniref:C2H2-type domain-containing protein n=1 Tax=Colletotrichum phormii TaxID=359342 RepID=A0AAJ0A3E8_9PEZI|nr:uncharacterized protein BDP81DRAFT_445206 [Colletotrichum phormii]KAK1654356.1 hypothetical protein BDP81DRAFT_445206 [Colletotrichum phormii]
MDPTKHNQMASMHSLETRAGMEKSTSQGFLPQKTPMPWALMEFYGNDASQPWVPPGIIPESHQGQQLNVSGDPRRRNHAVFNGGWRSPLPSDCGTMPQGYLPSDSGYESRTKHSVENASVFNDVDRSQDTHSISGQLMDFQLSATPTEPQWNLATAHMSVAHHGAADNKLVCDHCRAPCKTKSELNKHHQRHQKAFKCDVQGCTRIEGFGTQNDLERHKGSVHPEFFSSGPRYRCQRDSCATKTKIWPRADNFRQHLKRVHSITHNPEDDLREYVLQTTQKSLGETYHQSTQDVLEGVGVGSEVFYHTTPISWGDGPSPMYDDVQLSPQDSVGGMEINLINPSLTQIGGSASDASLESSIADKVISNPQLHDNNCHAVCDSSQSRQQYVQPGDISKAPSPRIIMRARRSPKSNANRENHSASAPAAMSLNIASNANGSSRARNEMFDSSPTDVLDCEVTGTGPILCTSAETTVGSQPTNKDSAQEEQIFDQSLPVSPSKSLSEQAMLDFLSKMPKNIIETFMKSQMEWPLQRSTPTTNGSADGQHRCSDSSCGKVFKRKCELKKHMKRHEKPYGCTFAGCKKKFGSKNDWKRHENSQHFQLEVWKCSEKRPENDNESCGKVCHRRETFRSHLQKEHKMDDSSNIEKVLEKCRVGRNGEPKFWCGFCVEICEISKKGANAWAEKFDHIDNHYAGRSGYTKKDHSQWVAVDTDLPDVDLTGSSDDLSDVDSADENVIVSGSRKLTNNGRGVNGQSRKRGLDDGAEQPGHKRMRTYMWECCSCSWDADYKLHSACVNCFHHRCKQCSGKWVQVQEDRDANSTGDNSN